MAEWDSQSDSFNMETSGPLDLDQSMENPTSSTPIAKSHKRRSDQRISLTDVQRNCLTDVLRKTPTGLPHYPQAPPSVGTGAAGHSQFTTENPSTAHVHTDFHRDFGDMFDDDDFE